jgi:hypothetical protein
MRLADPHSPQTWPVVAVAIVGGAWPAGVHSNFNSSEKLSATHLNT